MKLADILDRRREDKQKPQKTFGGSLQKGALAGASVGGMAAAVTALVGRQAVLDWVQKGGLRRKLGASILRRATLPKNAVPYLTGLAGAAGAGAGLIPGAVAGGSIYLAGKAAKRILPKKKKKKKKLFKV